MGGGGSKGRIKAIKRGNGQKGLVSNPLWPAAGKMPSSTDNFAPRVGLAYAIVSAVVEGPPVLVGDPLTTQGAYTIGPGNLTSISGEITGGDYVIGNYSSIQPVGTNIGLSVYNSSGWATFQSGGAATPAWSPPPSPGGRIVYSAPVTDTYYFVFSNPYPVSSHLTVEVYVTTTYESNVGGDGFG